MEAGAEGALHLSVEKIDLGSEFHAIPVGSMGASEATPPPCVVNASPADPSFSQLSRLVKSEATWMTAISQALF